MKNFVFGLILLLGVAIVATGQEHVKQRLEDSPRHQEWVSVTYGERTVHCFLVYPETKNNATAVVVIHENRGLTDWVRGVADQLAEAGYIAIAPDLLSGMGPDGGKTSDFPTSDAAREAISKLNPDRVTADLNAATDYVSKLPACNGSVTVAGFCWGGAQSFRFATNRWDLRAAFVFYGTGPDAEDAVKKISCPVYGFYGGNDARVNATISQSKELMASSKKTYDPVTYEGAGHGFMRLGEEPKASEANKSAREAAWKRWKSLLEGIKS